jgi:MoxR-like ATPase
MDVSEWIGYRMELPEAWTRLRLEASKALVGLDEAFQQVAIALFSGGHVLLEGVPGTGKTLMAKVIARLVQGEYRRIQFTPDLMPSDVVGTSVFDLATSGFRVHQGPLFAQVLLADEINRAPAKTQAALLEAMEERQATIDGVSYPLPAPFIVAATQNPVEYEGTYPLPEAQLDRFQFKILVDYRSAQEEEEVLRRHVRGFGARPLAENLTPVLSPSDVLTAQRSAESVRVDDTILAYVTAIARASRRSPDLSLGASPRASIGIVRAIRVRALMDGRDFALPDDVKALVPPAYRHRVILKPEAEIQGVTPDDAIARVLARVDVPR